MPPARHLRAACACLLLSLAGPTGAFAMAPGNGRLQIIHLDVGQGDGAVLISPNGQVAMFDNGTGGVGAIGKSVPAQLQALGVTGVEHHFCSHYHSDHFGGTPSIVSSGIPITNGWDRGIVGLSTPTTGAYNSYVTALGTHRKTLVKGQVITLDSLSAHPVLIKCVDLGGAGVSVPVGDENSLSMVMKVTYGEFDMTFGGDLPGQTGSYVDIETTIGPEVGPVEVYKVHHHGSATSSMDSWLNATTPKLAVISCGNGNSYHHPTASALARLHNHGVKTYWTELGTGVAPVASVDKVSNGQIVISATWDGAGVDTIRGNGFTDTFINSGTASVDAIAPLAILASPDGGEVLKAGSSQSVTWSASDNVGVTTVDLDWSSDGGSTWSAIATAIANTGSYPWTVPAQATTAGLVRVRARDAAGNLGADSSASLFTVDFWTVAASAGLGGAVDPAGIVNVVQGANSSFAFTPLAGCVVQDVVVDGVPQGALASWQFTAVAAHHTLAASFLDVAPPLVTLASPLGGELLTPGSACAITWTATDNLGVDSVDVDVAYDGVAGPWFALAHGLANTGNWSWTVPAQTTDSARVRVTVYDVARNSGAATSDSAFAIGSLSAGVGEGGPVRLALAPPAPNPAAGAVSLRFSLPAEGEARVEVLDLLGRRVGQYAGVFAAGSHGWTWDGRNAGGSRAGAGIYLVRLHTAQGTRTQRLVLLR